MQQTTIRFWGSVRDETVARYLVSAALITSGLCTIMQVTRIPLGQFRGRKFQLGTGLISVMGTSFTWLTIAQEALELQAAEGKTFNESYGAILGTFAAFVWIEIFLAFVPPKVLRRVIPPLVSGVAVSLIGLGLIGSGFYNWGGGTFCGQNFKGFLPATQISESCYVADATVPEGYSEVGECYKKPFIPLCDGNGDVLLNFGSGAYFGLGFSVLGFMVLIEILGSPFLKNMNVVLGLLFGCILSVIIKVDGNSFWTTEKMDNAPGLTFLWTTTFPLGFYSPIILPTIIAYIVTAVETMGDIAATEEASELVPEGRDHEARVQGGVLGDALYSLFAVLGMSTPNTTFSQNSGVIALTRCASKYAGYMAGIILLICGIIGKIGAFFTSIPNCVLGGMTTFLFANVLVSGIKIIVMQAVTRRNRFILAASLGLGIGVTIVPQWANSPIGLWPVTPDMSSGLRGLRSAVIIFLSTGYAIGTVTAMVLHLLLPCHEDDVAGMQAVKRADWAFHTGDPSVKAAEKALEDPSVTHAGKAHGGDVEAPDQAPAPQYPAKAKEDSSEAKDVAAL